MASQQSPRIALVHALAASVDPIATAFAQHWPAARTFNLLDDSLSRDREADGELTPGMTQRFLALARYAAQSGSAGDPTAAILFTCSAFGPAIEAVKQDLSIPVLNPNQAAFDAAVSLGPRIALIVTFPPSAESLRGELEALAESRGLSVNVQLQLAEGALECLHHDDGERHDRLIAEAARRSVDCDVVVLGQFSMARAAETVAAATGAKVLTTPDAAVNALHALLDEGNS